MAKWEMDSSQFKRIADYLEKVSITLGGIGIGAGVLGTSLTQEGIIVTLTASVVCFEWSLMLSKAPRESSKDKNGG